MVDNRRFEDASSVGAKNIRRGSVGMVFLWNWKWNWNMKDESVPTVGKKCCVLGGWGFGDFVGVATGSWFIGRVCRHVLSTITAASRFFAESKFHCVTALGVWRPLWGGWILELPSLPGRKSDTYPPSRVLCPGSAGCSGRSPFFVG